VNSAATLDFPFIEDLPKREKSKIASLWDTLKEARAATQEHGSLVPINFAAELLGISRQRMHVLLDEGKVTPVQFHNQRFVSEKSLVAWAKSERQVGRPLNPRAPSLKQCLAIAREK
jgi:hypothetical protein